MELETPNLLGLEFRNSFTFDLIKVMLRENYVRKRKKALYI